METIGQYNAICVILLKSCVLEGKIVLVFWLLLHNLHFTDFIRLDLDVDFLYFLSNSVHLLGILNNVK